MPDSPILLLAPGARAGRTGYRLNVKEMKHVRSRARWMLGNTRDDGPTVVELLEAAKCLSALLFDATEGDARLVVRLGKNTDAGREFHSPVVVLSTLTAHDA